MQNQREELNKLSPYVWLGNNDPIMKRLVEKHGELALNKSADFFLDLASSIVGQQLSVKAARTIWGRVEVLLGGIITPERVFAVADEDLRGAGLSTGKTKYIKNLAEAVVSGTLELDKLNDLSDEEIIKQLTAVKGIGKWTAEMFLMFSLARPNVFSLGDVGLYNSMRKLYGEDLSKEQILEIIAKWQPWQTYACLYLWRDLDNEGVKINE
ncbi:MAG: DNA-3-methyladenine glycosylase [Firmicutes bacterium]|nr:DNA-3-methyladenine glycosylase [Bacillota bacterium]